MSATAVTRRLRQVERLRRACLALADSDVGRALRQRCADNSSVQRTSQALGR